MIIENKSTDGNQSFQTSQNDTNVLFFYLLWCIMMVVKMAATTATIKYVLV